MKGWYAVSNTDGKWVMRPQNALYVTGDPDSGNGEFFVILTLQRGAAPAVKAEGNGLAAKVTVGGQRISFDGRKVVLAK